MAPSSTGTGGPRYRADVGISGGRIEAIGALGHAESARRIDASGHVVAPGFIDIHSHSDITLFDDPGGESKAHQGVTTEVTGNCSYTPWPVGKGGPEALQKNLGRTLIGSVKWEWHTLDDWANALESNGISINVAPQLGHSGLQIASGAVEDRPATPDELREMKRLAAEAMEMGAFSLSTGLSVAPSAYGTTADIVALCESIRHYEGAFYATHARVGNGLHMSALGEAIEIGQRAGIPVQFSHLAITDRRVYGQGATLTEPFVRAREGGLDTPTTCTPTPRRARATTSSFPSGRRKAASQSSWPASATPQRGRAYETRSEPDWEDFRRNGRHGTCPISSRMLTVIASARTSPRSPRSVASSPPRPSFSCSTRRTAPVPTRVHNRVEDDVRYFMGHELAMIGSDGRAVSPHGPYRNALPHPRFYGTYPRILGRYVREQPAVLTLENAIYKMTGFPAKRLHLKDRGLVKEGLTADLAIFDPATVIDNSTWEDPHQYPDGIPHVLVKGVPVVDGGTHTARGRAGCCGGARLRVLGALPAPPTTHFAIRTSVTVQRR